MTNLRATLATVAKAARLRYALLFLALLVALYWTGIRPWMANWGSTAAEQQLILPGDELHPDRTSQSTLAITIDAPPEVVCSGWSRSARTAPGSIPTPGSKTSSAAISTTRTSSARSGNTWPSGIAGGWSRATTSGAWAKARPRRYCSSSPAMRSCSRCGGPS